MFLRLFLIYFFIGIHPGFSPEVSLGLFKEFFSNVCATYERTSEKLVQQIEQIEQIEQFRQGSLKITQEIFLMRPQQQRFLKQKSFQEYMQILPEIHLGFFLTERKVFQKLLFLKFLQVLLDSF